MFGWYPVMPTSPLTTTTLIRLSQVIWVLRKVKCKHTVYTCVALNPIRGRFGEPHLIDGDLCLMCVLNQLSTGQFPCQALQPGYYCLICSQGPVEWTYTLTSKVLFNGLTLIHTTHRQDMTHCTLRCPKKTSCHWIQLTTYKIMYFTSYNGNYNGEKKEEKNLNPGYKLIS